MKMTDKRKINILIAICCGAYFCSYLTRINFAAVIIELVKSEGLIKSQVSLAVTGLFVTYGIGQLVSGWMGDRLPPQYLMFGGLIVSGCMNIAITLSINTVYMTVIWCINGFAQAMLWPPLVKIMSNAFDDLTYKKACVYVSWSSSFGTIIVYLIAPLCIVISSWRLLFYICGGIALVMAFVWLFVFPSVYVNPEALHQTPIDSECERPKMPRFIIPMLCTVMVAIALQGLLRDGITTWMPAYVSENFNIGSSISILTGIALPLFSLLSFMVTSFLVRRVFKNELKCTASIFIVATLATAVIYFWGTSSPVISVMMFTLATGCMHGTNLILICMISPYFARYGNVSFISGLLNCFTYVGSALSTYGIAAVTERKGWDTSVLIWCVAAFLGFLLCSVCIKKWERFKNKVEDICIDCVKEK